VLEDRLAPAVYAVNSLADLSIAHGVDFANGQVKDAQGNDTGTVTLRSAVEAANHTPGGNTINLGLAGNYQLTLQGTPGEVDNQAGELAILPGGDLSIVNTSGGAVTVTGSGTSRVFDINPTPTFTATLTGANQVPANQSAATGTGTIVLTNDETAISFSTTFAGLDQPPTGAHLHIAPAGSNATGGQPLDANGNALTDPVHGIALDANGNPIELAIPAGTGTTGALGPQTFAVTPGFLAQLEAGNVYENIHDAPNFPAGEIRGQFAPTAPFTVSMTGFTITGGRATSDNDLGMAGGGIRDVGNASLTLTNMVVSGNTANGDGGGIVMANLANTPWKLTLNHTTVSGNHAGDAGGGIDTDGSGQVFVNPGSVLSNNTSTNQGAGIWIDAIQVTQNGPFLGANLTVTGAVISGNRALTADGGLGGGIGNAGNGTIIVTGSTVSGNTAGLTGGGFGDENGQGTLIVSGSAFLNNTALGNGGAIAAGGPATTITSSEIDGNAAGGAGGGVFANGLTLTVSASTFSDNTAAGGGGALEVDTAGAGADGSTITNATITGNRALNVDGANGGGIEAGQSGSLALLNDTIDANQATNGGGVFWTATAGSQVSLQNSVVAGNLAIGPGPDLANNQATGAYADLGNNLIGIAGDGSGFSTSGAPNTLAGDVTLALDPLLGPLTTNGGPNVGAAGQAVALQTQAPQDGSFLLGNGNAAAAPPTDERGFPSVIGGLANIGAESDPVGLNQPAPPGSLNPIGPVSDGTVIDVVSLADNNNPVITAGHAGTSADPFQAPSLRSAISFANANPGNFTINLAVPGVYKLTIPGRDEDAAATGDLDILAKPGGDNLTLQNTSPDAVAVEADNNDRVFDINSPFDPNNPTAAFTVTMVGFTIRGGLADGAGGGIRDTGNASLTLADMVISGNIAETDGGGIAMENPTNNEPWTLTLFSTTISGNHAGDAGGGIDTDGSGQVNLNLGSVLSNNTSTNQGAGIWLDAIQVGPDFLSANLDAIGVVVSGNRALTAGGVGGGIGNAGSGTVDISNSSVTNNFAGATGGGFGDENGQGFLDISGSTFLNNTAVGNGGGIAAGGAQPQIDTTEIDGNASGGAGGGVFANGQRLVLTNSTLSDNTSAGNGGGVEIDTTGPSSISNSTLTGNRAVNAGGASGGGIDAGADFTGSLTLLNDTIDANFAALGGGVFWAGAAGSQVSLQNTIVAANAAPVGPDLASYLLFTAALGADPNVPIQGPVGTGAASLLVGPDFNRLFPDLNSLFNASWSGLPSPAAAVRIRNAPPGQNGPLVFDATGVPAATTGSIIPQLAFLTLDNLMQALLGNLYVQVLFGGAPPPSGPAGALRGQLALSGGVFTDQGNNLIGVTGTGSGFYTTGNGTTRAGTVDNPLNPLLAPLADNNGPPVGAPGQTMTLQTQSPLAGSPALGNAVNVLPNDERGVPRAAPDDIGAFFAGDALTAFFLQSGVLEHVPLDQVAVAIFHDNSNPTAPPSQFTATVMWDDGTTSAGTIINPTPNNYFVLVSGHTFADEGLHPVSVKIQVVNSPRSITVSGMEPVGENDALSNGVAFAISAAEATPFSGAVAQFSDSDTVTAAGDFAATIDWGDGSTPSAGTVSGGNGRFLVSGGHTYAEGGPHTLSVTLTDADGTASLTASTAITVAEAPALSELQEALGAVAALQGPGLSAADAQLLATAINDLTAATNLSLWVSPSQPTDGNVTTVLNDAQAGSNAIVQLLAEGNLPAAPLQSALAEIKEGGQELVPLLPPGNNPYQAWLASLPDRMAGL
jgi:hypothetical protein